MDGLSFTTRLVEEVIDTDDPSKIRDAELFMTHGLSLRMIVLPVGQGKTLIWKFWSMDKL